MVRADALFKASIIMQQLHQVIIRIKSHCLKDKHIASTHIFLNLKRNFTIGKMFWMRTLPSLTSRQLQLLFANPGCDDPENNKRLKMAALSMVIHNRVIIWGGRIRTSAWRYQKPLPYRLATPQ